MELLFPQTALISPGASRGRSFGLYLHLPYCVQKCPYCDFNSYALEKKGFPESAYVDALLAELRFRANQSEWQGREIETIFFGGGTPSLFSAGSINRVLTEVRASFPILSGAEVTLEANPGTLEEELRMEKLAGFLRAGVNRVSFGAQSFTPSKLQFLGRIHSPDDTVSALKAAREVGFKSINLDLMFGVAGEKLDFWKVDLETALSLQPEHLSAYALTIEPGTPFGRRTRDGAMLQGEEDVVAEMFEFTYEHLKSEGYQRYEISNFARHTQECRHNLGYWEGRDYLGLGAGAHSFFGCPPSTDQKRTFGYRWSNAPGPEHYIQRAMGKGDASQLREEINDELARIEFFFLGLRTVNGVATAKYHERFGEPMAPRYNETIRKLIEAQLLVQSNGQVKLSDRGFLFADTVLSAFASESGLRTRPSLNPLPVLPSL